MTDRPLEDQAEDLPTTAGVYLFKDRDGAVLYVGKASNLRARVRQYLAGHDERFMVRYLVAAASRVEVVPTSSEKEALLLENSLIKQHQPRYNKHGDVTTAHGGQRLAGVAAGRGPSAGGATTAGSRRTS